MRAMVLAEQPGTLREVDLPAPVPGEGQVLVRVSSCGVCRTDVHIADGELSDAKLPLVPGHQVVGRVEAVGPGARRFSVGERLGVPWLGWTCGECGYCLSGRENLCPGALFTGYTLDGGYAELVAADERYCLALGGAYSDAGLAPLLCAGLIGYRAYRIAGEGERLGLYGFGSSAHILCQIAAGQGRRVFAFTRPGDAGTQSFARKLGAEWAGGSDERAPEPLDAAIVFAPAGPLMVTALEHSAPGATIVSAGIQMTDIPSFPYGLLWEERSLRSVANLTREDGGLFLEAIERVPVTTEVETLPLSQANEAIERIREGEVTGSLVLEI